MATKDRQVRYAQRLSREDELEVARAKKLGADDAHQGHPAEQRQDPEQPEHVRLNDARENDEHEQDRQPGKDLDHPLADEVDKPAKIALQRAHEHADARTDDRERDAEQDGEPEPVEELREHVRAAAIGAEEVSAVGSAVGVRPYIRRELRRHSAR